MEHFFLLKKVGSQDKGVQSLAQGYTEFPFGQYLSNRNILFSVSGRWPNSVYHGYHFPDKQDVHICVFTSEKILTPRVPAV